MTTVTKKKVNVKTNAPITGLRYPVAGVANGITLTINEILICIRSKAKVEEVIGNRTIPLDFTNYNKDNSIVIAKPEELKAVIMDVKQVDGKLVIESQPEQVEVKLEQTVEIKSEQTAEEVPVVQERVIAPVLPIAETTEEVPESTEKIESAVEAATLEVKEQVVADKVEKVTTGKNYQKNK
jgi:hypothetical protein